MGPSKKPEWSNIGVVGFWHSPITRSSSSIFNFRFAEIQPSSAVHLSELDPEGRFERPYSKAEIQSYSPLPGEMPLDGRFLDEEARRVCVWGSAEMLSPSCCSRHCVMFSIIRRIEPSAASECRIGAEMGQTWRGVIFSGKQKGRNNTGLVACVVAPFCGC